MSPIQILQGDCRELLAQLPADSVHTCVSSPPYFALRSYLPADHPDKPLELGAEATIEAYVANLVAVFRAVRRVLRPDGTLWLNLGDTYSRNPKKGGSGTPTGRNNRGEGYAGSGLAGLPEKSLIGVPWRVAFGLQDDGWLLRSDIIWSKPAPMPEGVRDRPTRAHEYVFLLTQQAHYYYDRDAIREPSQAPPAAVNRADWQPRERDGLARQGFRTSHRIYHPLGRDKRSVWTVGPQPFRGAHFATFPPDLVRPMILAGCPPSGTILDPFAGSGTVGLVAQELGRAAILMDLNPVYTAMASGRLFG